MPAGLPIAIKQPGVTHKISSSLCQFSECGRTHRPREDACERYELSSWCAKYAWQLQLGNRNCPTQFRLLENGNHSVQAYYTLPAPAGNQFFARECALSQLLLKNHNFSVQQVRYSKGYFSTSCSKSQLCSTSVVQELPSRSMAHPFSYST